MSKTDSFDTKFHKRLDEFKSSTKTSMEAARDLANMGISKFAELNADGVICGDVTYCQKFLDAMPRNYNRVSAFIKWLQDHAPVKTEGSLKDGYHLIRDKSPDAQELNLEGAISKPFWDYSPAKEDINYSADDVLKAAERVVSKYGKSNHHATSDLAVIMVHKLDQAIRHLRANAEKPPVETPAIERDGETINPETEEPTEAAQA